MKYSNRHLLCRTHLVMRFCFLLIAFGLFGGGACQLCQKKHVWKNPIPADSVANHCELTTVSKLFLSEDGDSSTSDYRNALFRCVDQAYQTASISNSPAQAVATQRTLRFTKGARNAMLNLVPTDPGTTVSLNLMDLG